MTDADDGRFFSWFLQLAAVTALMMAPIWVMLALKWPQFPDMLAFSLYISAFSSQFWHGEWYPRWLMDVNAGYGSPVFLFYPPLSFFLMVPFEWLRLFDPHGFVRLTLAMWMALLCCGVTSYYWLRGHFPEPKAREGALLYAGFPFLFTITYYSCISWLFAIALFPAVLAAMDRMRAITWGGVPLLAVVLCLLCLANPISLLTFLPVMIAYGLFMAQRKRRLLQAFLVGCSGLCGMGLSAAYLMPFVRNQPSIQANLYYSDGGSYGAFFFDNMQPFGFYCIILPLLIIYACKVREGRDDHPITPPERFWIVIITMLFYLTLVISKWLWDMVPLLKYVQLPRRFCGPMIPGAVFLWLMWTPRCRHYLYGCLFVAMIAYTTYLSWYHHFSDSDWQLYHSPFLAVGDSGEYQTRWMDDAIRMQKMPSGPERVGILEGRGSVQIVRWQPREIDLHAEVASETARVWLHRFYFPGWVGDRVAVEPGQGGLMTLALPKGTHDLVLTVPEFAGERMGNFISAATLCLLISWWWLWRRQSPQVAGNHITFPVRRASLVTRACRLLARGNRRSRALLEW